MPAFINAGKTQPVPGQNHQIYNGDTSAKTLESYAGSKTFSPDVIGRKPAMFICPNAVAANEEIKLAFANMPAGRIFVIMHSQDVSAVYSKTVLVKAGNSTAIIRQPENVLPGVYYITVSNGKKFKQVKKIIVTAALP